jgi:hypothetical protein
VAAWLWIIWAVVVWNLVFDLVIIEAGREYVRVARAAAIHGSYAKIDDTMRPARSRALWLATASAGLILLVGVAALKGPRYVRRATLSGSAPISAEHPRRT